MLANSAEMELTGCYSNGNELLAGLKKKLPDILLLDIHMPGRKGDELADIIIKEYPTVKILVLTNEDNVYHIKNMMKRKVHGYILKTTSEDITLDAIQQVYAGKQYMETGLKEKIKQDTIQAKKDMAAGPVLSDREIDVLRCISLDMTSQQIAEKILLSKHTIDYYRASLLTKLGVKNVGALVKKGIQLGLIE